VACAVEIIGRSWGGTRLGEAEAGNRDAVASTVCVANADNEFVPVTELQLAGEPASGTIDHRDWMAWARGPEAVAACGQRHRGCRRHSCPCSYPHFREPGKAAAVAQLVSIPVGLLGLSGTVFTRPPAVRASAVASPQHYSPSPSSTPSWWMEHGDLALRVGLVAFIFVSVMAFFFCDGVPRESVTGELVS
jgi:hypothetical protein